MHQLELVVAQPNIWSVPSKNFDERVAKGIKTGQIVFKAQRPIKIIPDVVKVKLPVKKQKKKRSAPSADVVGVRISGVPKVKTLMLNFLDRPLSQTKILVNAVDVVSPGGSKT